MGRMRNRQRTRQYLVAYPHYELVPLRGALEQCRLLPAGSVVTVTTSSRQGTEATIALIEAIAAEGFVAVPHLAARQVADEKELLGVLERLERAGVRHVFVVGGDATERAGPYPDGLALLRAIDRLGYRFDEVGVPSYPEGHYAIDDETLWTALIAKQPYATYTVTQMCFDAETIVRFAAEAARRGIRLPVRVGIPGVVDTRKLLQISMRIGVGDSARFMRGNARVARQFLSPKGYRPDPLARRLVGEMARQSVTLAGLHVYTFNHVGPTVRWLRQITRERVA